MKVLVTMYSKIIKRSWTLWKTIVTIPKFITSDIIIYFNDKPTCLKLSPCYGNKNQFKSHTFVMVHEEWYECLPVNFNFKSTKRPGVQSSLFFFTFSVSPIHSRFDQLVRVRHVSVITPCFLTNKADSPFHVMQPTKVKGSWSHAHPHGNVRNSVSQSQGYPSMTRIN